MIFETLKVNRRLLRDPKAARDFEGGTFRLATVDEFPASKRMSGGLMVINKAKQRNLHWHVDANEWQYYLRGKGQVALFGSGGRGKVTGVVAGDGLRPCRFRARHQEHRRRRPYRTLRFGPTQRRG